MSEQQSQTTAGQERPAPQAYNPWPDYWVAQGIPWRTEPEISDERQRYLAERRGVTADVEHDIYPFKDITLDRADVEWLLATHENDGIVGPINPYDETQHNRQGLNLVGARLEDAN